MARLFEYIFHFTLLPLWILPRVILAIQFSLYWKRQINFFKMILYVVLKSVLAQLTTRKRKISLKLVGLIEGKYCSDLDIKGYAPRLFWSLHMITYQTIHLWHGQNEEVALLEGEKEAEKMIVEAYSALLLAFLSTERFVPFSLYYNCIKLSCGFVQTDFLSLFSQPGHTRCHCRLSSRSQPSNSCASFGAICGRYSLSFLMTMARNWYMKTWNISRNRWLVFLGMIVWLHVSSILWWGSVQSSRGFNQLIESSCADDICFIFLSRHFIWRWTWFLRRRIKP